MKKPSHPPKWLDRLLSWYCRPDMLEDLQGDLHEYYHRNLGKGKLRADLIFLMDVLKFFRPYTIRKPQMITRMNFLSIFANNLKTSTRSLARNKLFSAINVIGLAISMSIGILMITYVSELLHFDSSHKNGDRIYRIISTYKGITDEMSMHLASTSIFIGQKLKEDYPGIEKLALMRRGFSPDLSSDLSTLNASGLWASSEFFDVFSFEMTSGNPQTALAEPNSLVITETLAKKLFKEENPIGQTVKLTGLERYDFTAGMITGVVQDPPKNSHIQFEVLGSFKTLEKHAQGLEEKTHFFNEYGSIWMNYVYMLLPEQQDPAVVQGYLEQVAEEEGAKYDRFAITYSLENLHDIVPGKNHSNQIGPTVEWKTVYIFSALTLIVLISACFNYTNLSIARSLRRAKEVGIRKIIGAGRSQVFMQFIFEAIIISVIALMIASGLFVILKPEFINLILRHDPVTLDFQWIYAFYFLGFAIVIGFMAGFIPAMVLSRLKALSVLKDVTKVKLFSGVSLRRVLIVFQFTLSIGFIIATTISYRQYRFATSFDLGYNTKNILNIPLKGNDSDILVAEYLKLPEVHQVSKSAMIPSTGSVWGETAKYKDPMDSVDIDINYVDANYLDVHGFELLAGGTFPFDLKKEDEPKFVIINERLLERFSIGEPADAIGEVLSLDQGKQKLEIVGVVKDFHHLKISDDHAPFAFLQDSEHYNVLNLKVQADDPVALMSKLEEKWKGIDQVHPFEAQFFDDQIQEAYMDFKVYFRVVGFLAFLAISIATMGLLGMAVFTTETRLKEISIRKVLGASEQNLVYLLSRGFVVMLIIAAAIAVPATYLLFENLVLADFANRITIGFFELFSGVVIIFGIGFLTIGWQTSAAARTNPADMLRDE